MMSDYATIVFSLFLYFFTLKPRFKLTLSLCVGWPVGPPLYREMSQVFNIYALPSNAAVNLHGFDNARAANQVCADPCTLKVRRFPTGGQ